MKKILISDYSLRSYAQDASQELLFREKTALAECLEGIGVDQIELPAVTRPKEDRIIGKTIASLLEHAGLAIPVGTTPDGAAAAWDCVREAKHPCLQVMLPVATAQMEYSFRAKEAAMRETIIAAVQQARSFSEEVEFCALDATRADPAFLLDVCAAAVENGATRVTLCDETGACLPEEIAALVRQLREAIPVPLLVSLTDSIQMANACALAALTAGADGVKTALSGTNVLHTETFAALLSARGEELGLSSNLKMTQLHHDASAISRQMLRTALPANADAAPDGDVYLDAQSTLTDVCAAAESLGYTLADEDVGRVYQALRQLFRQNRSIGAKELEALIASYAMQVPSTYHLDSYSASCGNIGLSMAQVTLRREDELLGGVATGDGPIDAAFRAIEQSVGYHYELDEFQIQAVTEGKEALGSALVRLRSNGTLYVGNGISSDIVGASIRAYINALNKIVFEER